MRRHKKPLNCKSYGSIPHIQSSKLGYGDHRLSDGQERILFKKTRTKFDNIVITEKVDGANVAVTKVDGILYPMTRAGNTCNTSTFQTHIDFNDYVMKNYSKFDSVLEEREQISGEWLSIAHGTLYDLRKRDPFVVFDMFTKHTPNGRNRMLFSDTLNIIDGKFSHVPILYSDTNAANINDTHIKLGDYGDYGAIDFAEGFVIKCENLKRGMCEFMAKYVKPEITQGKYLKNNNSEQLKIHNFGFKNNDFNKYANEYESKFASIEMNIYDIIENYKQRIKQ